MRLEEAWMYLMDTLYPKGLNARLLNFNCNFDWNFNSNFITLIWNCTLLDWNCSFLYTYITNEQNWQDQLGEPKFEEEGLLHQKLFFKKNLMKMSLSKLHNDVQPLKYSTEQQMSILCDMCGKFFQHKSTYNRHIEHSHRDLSNFECKHCEKSFSRLDNIRRHVKNIHNDFLGQPF